MGGGTATAQDLAFGGVGMADIGGQWYVVPVDRHEPVEAFETIASDYLVFQVMPL